MNILIPQDGSASSEAAIEDMRRAGLPPKAKAFVIAVTGANPLSSSRSLATAAGKRIQLLFPQWELSTEAFSGIPAEVILKTAEWWRPDLLIIGSNTFATERSMSRSVSLEVVHRARCSVRVANSNGPFIPGRLHLASGSNGSGACEAAVQEIARRDWPGNTDVTIISVVESAPRLGKQRERDRLRTVDEKYANHLLETGLTMNRRIVDGDPGQELLRESDRCGADTIFIGPRCTPGMARFLLGSVATAVVTRARSTVEVVRQANRH